MDSQKLSLRQFFYTLRTHVSPEEGQRAARDAARCFLKGVAYGSHRVVAGYYPIRHELDTRPLLLHLADRSHRIALPCIEKHTEGLVFRYWDPSEPLVRHPVYPVMQPSSLSAVCCPSLIIIPLLAFDTKGNRLGYGGGFYDRTLQRMRKQVPGLLTAGYGYDFQRTPSLPAEPHDQALDYVVTNKESFTFL